MDVDGIGLRERGVVQPAREVVLDGQVGEVAVGSRRVDFEASGVLAGDQGEFSIDSGSRRPVSRLRVVDRHRLAVWRDAGPVDGEPVVAFGHVLDHGQSRKGRDGLGVAL